MPVSLGTSVMVGGVVARFLKKKCPVVSECITGAVKSGAKALACQKTGIPPSQIDSYISGQSDAIRHFFRVYAQPFLTKLDKKLPTKNKNKDIEIQMADSLKNATAKSFDKNI